MSHTKSSSKTLSIKVPRALSAKLVSLARKRRVPLSVVVREALETAGQQTEASFGELASDFCGRLSGPVDLSCNVDHLKGYGQ